MVWRALSVQKRSGPPAPLNVGCEFRSYLFSSWSNWFSYKDLWWARNTLRDARLRQAVFYLITEVPVIVFDINDLKQLSVPGALPDLVERKVKELFMQSGQIASRATGPCPIEIDVPDYLAEFKPL